jgi:RNA recognition motif-containing protein
VTEQELKEEFEQFGPLESVRILHDRFCAFVNFITDEDAVAAKQGMQGQILGSQYIVVNFRQTKAVRAYSFFFKPRFSFSVRAKKKSAGRFNKNPSRQFNLLVHFTSEISASSQQKKTCERSARSSARLKAFL